MRTPKDSTISVSVFKTIKARIIALEYPPGTLLGERMLAGALGVSRTPVREALLRLTQEGWIEWRNHRTAVVRQVALGDVRDVFELRRMIEPFAVRDIFSKGSSRLLAGKLDVIQTRMRENLSDRLEFITSDMLFHSALVGNMENCRLTRMWNYVSEELTRFGLMAVNQRDDRVVRVLEEHSRLIDALWEKNLEATLLALSDHHVKTYETLEESWTKGQVLSGLASDGAGNFQEEESFHECV